MPGKALELNLESRPPCPSFLPALGLCVYVCVCVPVTDPWMWEKMADHFLPWHLPWNVCWGPEDWLVGVFNKICMHRVLLLPYLVELWSPESILLQSPLVPR